MLNDFTVNQSAEFFSTLILYIKIDNNEAVLFSSYQPFNLLFS